MFGRQSIGILKPGKTVQLEPFQVEINHGDVVHPCVRYISEGYEGHKWWMVYTPYYGANSRMENPILCYSDSKTEQPPTDWKVYCLVNEQPETGFNSDPTLLYNGGVLYVYWRENDTPKTLKYGYHRVTYGGIVRNGGVEKAHIPIVYTKDSEEDAETCPTFMVNGEDSLVCYAMHLRFHSKRVQNLKSPWKGLVEGIIAFTDLLGIYSQQKHYGIAIWEGKDALSQFKYQKTVRFNNCNGLYRPWHMDLFDYGGKRYAIVQTNQCNADICLAESLDGETFFFLSKPLLTNRSLGVKGMYKPCAGVTSGGVFYLYYTAQNTNNRGVNKLYVTSMPFNHLLNLLK